MCVVSLRESQNTLPQMRWGWTFAELEKAQVHVELEIEAIWRARGDQRGRVIICHRGELWITQERDLVDYVLKEGEIFIVTLPGLVVVQARNPAALSVVTPSEWARPFARSFPIFP